MCLETCEFVVTVPLPHRSHLLLSEHCLGKYRSIWYRGRSGQSRRLSMAKAHYYRAGFDRSLCGQPLDDTEPFDPEVWLDEDHCRTCLKYLGEIAEQDLERSQPA